MLLLLLGNTHLSTNPQITTEPTSPKTEPDPNMSVGTKHYWSFTANIFKNRRSGGVARV